VTPPVNNTTHFFVGILEHSTVFRVTYTRGRIDTIDCPDDERLVARNMQRIGINKYKKNNCASSWLFTRTDILQVSSLIKAIVSNWDLAIKSYKFNFF